MNNKIECFTCECGGRFQKSNKTHHEKSAKHKHWVTAEYEKLRLLTVIQELQKLDEKFYLNSSFITK